MWSEATRVSTSSVSPQQRDEWANPSTDASKMYEKERIDFINYSIMSLI